MKRLSCIHLVVLLGPALGCGAAPDSEIAVKSAGVTVQCGAPASFAAPNYVRGVGFDAAGRYMSIATNPTAQVLDLDTDTVVESYVNYVVPEHLYPHTDASGALVVINGGSPTYLAVREVGGSNRVQIPNADPAAYHLSGDGSVIVYEEDDTERIYAYPVPASPAAYDPALRTQIATGRLQGVSDDGTVVLYGVARQAYVLDRTTNTTWTVPPTWTYEWVLSGDGRYIVTWDFQTLTRIEVGTGVRVDLTTSVKRLWQTIGSNPSPPAISDDGRYIVADTEEALDPLDTDTNVDIYVFDLQTGSAQVVFDPPNNAARFALSGDGSRVAMVNRAMYVNTSISVARNPFDCSAPPPGPEAQFDAELGAPACLGGPSCSTEALLLGRGPIGPEPNASNTLDGCADGYWGWFHADESLDAIAVYTLFGSDIAPSKVIVVDVTTWAWASGQYDYLDIYYARDAYAPVWQHVETVQGSGPGEQVYQVMHVLDDTPTRHAIRAQWRYSGSATPCSGGPFNDRDDLVLTRPHWQNAADRFDVNGDGVVTPLDVNVLITDLAANGERALPPPGSGPATSPFLDVTGDGQCTNADVDAVVDALGN